jgi:hypothetical protein
MSILILIVAGITILLGFGMMISSILEERKEFKIGEMPEDYLATNHIQNTTFLDIDPIADDCVDQLVARRLEKAPVRPLDLDKHLKVCDEDDPDPLI